LLAEIEARLIDEAYMERHRCADYSKALFFGKSVANKFENSLLVCAVVWLFALLLLSGTPEKSGSSLGNRVQKLGFFRSSFRRIYFLTLLLSALGACNGNEDSVNGLSTSSNLDLNGDGVLDVTYEHVDKGYYELVDRNFDGRVDESHFFDLQDRIVGSKIDNNFDGILETQVYYSDGSIARVCTDSNMDGLVDLFFEYVHGSLVGAKRYYHNDSIEEAMIGSYSFSHDYPVGPEQKVTAGLTAEQFSDQLPSCDWD
jgi:hypothetical protein